MSRIRTAGTHEDIRKGIADIDELLRLDPALTKVALAGVTLEDILKVRAEAIGILEKETGIVWETD